MLEIIGVVTASALLVLVQIRRQRKEWNNGICPYCRTKWIQFDQDSQGGRMYKCGTGQHYTDIDTWIDIGEYNGK